MSDASMWAANLLKCGICGKTHSRENNLEWVYYNGELYCRKHPGVLKWYEGALEIVSAKLEHLSTKLLQEDSNEV